MARTPLRLLNVSCSGFYVWRKQPKSAPQQRKERVTDITYIRVRRDWLYLAVALDLFSPKVIGWALEDPMRQELILESFISRLKVELIYAENDTTMK